MTDGPSGLGGGEEVFVFIESNTSGTGELCIRRARERGFRIVFLTAQPQLYPFLDAELVLPVAADTGDVDAICAVLAALPAIAGVMSTSDYFIETAARVAARLGLVGPDAEAVRSCRHKGRLARALAAAGVNVPRTIEADSVAALERIASDLAYPMVVKPVSGSGSTGVRLVADRGELLEAGAGLLAATGNERGLAVPPGILVQDYVAGAEYSVEVFGFDGRDHVLGCTAKHLGPEPYFVETGHDFPAPLVAGIEREIRAESARALRAVGYDSGPSHVECRIGGDGRPTIIEINPRLAGGMIPRAIEMAQGIDLLGALVDFHAGRVVDLAPRRNRPAAVRFYLAPRPGIVEAIRSPIEPACGRDDEAIFVPLKTLGSQVRPRGDFGDRLACIVASSADRAGLERSLAGWLGQDAVRLRDASELGTEGDTGRIKAILRPEALAIVRKPSVPVERIAELEQLSAIDEAHLVMLVRSGIIDAAAAAPVLAEIAALRAGRFSAIADRVAPRGVYALYEELLLGRLGERAGGIVHTARSRNDIHACLAKLQARGWLTRTFRSLWRLRSALLARAATGADIFLPVYSQFQPGQPGTLAYYLWSIDAALRRDQHALLGVLDELQLCPLGAGAGAGTDFPIRPEITADLLGFAASESNALDAVASRDCALRLLGAWAVGSTVLSRFAQDLQLWTMGDIGFFGLPDDLAGGSSMMPQKKNPYLLEIVKGKLVALPATLGFALHAAQKVPFGNSIEAGTEAVSGCPGAAGAYAESCDLLRMIVTALEPRPEATLRAGREAGVSAAQFANALVREGGMSFHEAHRAIGARIAAALEAGDEPLAAVKGLTGEPLDDLLAAAAALSHGGGPGAVEGQLEPWRRGLRQASETFFARSSRWDKAERDRAAAVRSLIGGELA